MTVVRLRVVDYPDVFWDKFGEVVSSVEISVSTTWNIILARN